MSYAIPERVHGVREENFRESFVATRCGNRFAMRKCQVDLSGKRVLVQHRPPRSGDPVPHVCHNCDRITGGLYGS